MNETDIRKYAGLMEELGLTGLEVHENTDYIRLERGGTAVPAAAPAAPAAAPAETPREQDDCYTVRSPMVGVFYEAPAENAAPFVKVGDRVKKGDVLCIVEAMKLMNEILADQEGEIVEVCARNGQVVDYGCDLFRVRR